MRPLRSPLAVSVVLLTAALGNAIPGSSSFLQATTAGWSGSAPSFLIVENAGQFDPAVRFQARAGNSVLWVTDRSLWLTWFEPDLGPRSAQEPAPDAGTRREPRRGVHLELTFLGGRATVPVGTELRPTRMNYFLGSDPSRWRSGVRTYGGVTWRGLYPGLSVTLTEVGGEPALAVDVRSEADAARLRLRVVGARAVRASGGGRLVAVTALGGVPLLPVVRGDRSLAPQPKGVEVSFRSAGGARVPAARQVPRGGLEYGTFLGGSDEEEAFDFAIGPDGSAYVAGETFSSDFPTTAGAFDRIYNDGGDVFVSRLDAAGSTLVYSTFLGGRDWDTAYSVAVGSDGSAYVGGRSFSPDFPTTPDSFDPSFNGGFTDSFVSKLNPQGAGLAYSTFLGGRTSAERIFALATAPTGALYATGETYSRDYPTTPGAFDRIINDDGVGFFTSDAFLTALNPAGSDLLSSTFLGGSDGDYGYGVMVGPRGAAYVTGSANSEDFPTTPFAYDRTFNGGNNDLFVTRMNKAGSRLVFSTYVGGADNDDGRAVALDEAGNVYIVGYTSSPDYPTTSDAYDTTINSFILADAVVTKLTRAGGALIYSTFLGGADTDLAYDLSLDPDGSANLTGTTYSPNFPTTAGAFDRSFGDPRDAFVSRLDPTGSELAYSTFLGGTAPGTDGAVAIGSPTAGTVSVGGSTSSTDFPVTPDAYDTSFNGVADAFVRLLTVTVAVN